MTTQEHVLSVAADHGEEAEKYSDAFRQRIADTLQQLNIASLWCYTASGTQARMQAHSGLMLGWVIYRLDNRDGSFSWEAHLAGVVVGDGSDLYIGSWDDPDLAMGAIDDHLVARGVVLVGGKR